MWDRVQENKTVVHDKLHEQKAIAAECSCQYLLSSQMRKYIKIKYIVCNTLSMRNEWNYRQYFAAYKRVKSNNRRLESSNTAARSATFCIHPKVTAFCIARRWYRCDRNANGESSFMVCCRRAATNGKFAHADSELRQTQLFAAACLLMQSQW